MLSRGKRMLKASLFGNVQACKRPRRNSRDPTAESKFWIRTGLDRDGFELKFINCYKGYGVFATKPFDKGDFLLQYCGERLNKEEALRREKKYRCSFLYFFKSSEKECCIDATNTGGGRLGHMVNDAPMKEANSKMRLVEQNLCLFAMRQIAAGEEIMYDYGDDAHNLWWRKEKKSYLIKADRVTMLIRFGQMCSGTCDPDKPLSTGGSEDNQDVPDDSMCDDDDDDDDDDPFGLNTEREKYMNKESPDSMSCDSVKESCLAGDLSATQVVEDSCDSMENSIGVHPLGGILKGLLQENVSDFGGIPTRREVPDRFCKNMKKASDTQYFEETCTETEMDSDSDWEEEYLKKMLFKDQESSGSEDDEDEDCFDDLTGSDMISSLPEQTGLEKSFSKRGSELEESCSNKTSDAIDSLHEQTEVEKSSPKKTCDVIDFLHEQTELEKSFSGKTSDVIGSLHEQTELEKSSSEKTIDVIDFLHEQTELEKSSSKQTSVVIGSHHEQTELQKCSSKKTSDAIDSLHEQAELEKSAPKKTSDVIGSLHEQTKLEKSSSEKTIDVIDFLHEQTELEKSSSKQTSVVIGSHHEQTELEKSSSKKTSDAIYSLHEQAELEKSAPKKTSDVIGSLHEQTKLEKSSSEKTIDVIDFLHEQTELEKSSSKQTSVVIGSHHEQTELEKSSSEKTIDIIGSLHEQTELEKSSSVHKTGKKSEDVPSVDVKKYKKPDRCCAYCHTVVSGGKLKRHIMRKHKQEEEVKQVLAMPEQLQHEFFEQKRLDGMYEYNLKHLADPKCSHEKLMRERQPKYSDGLRMCSGCKKFLSNRSYYKHSQECSSLDAQPLKPCLLASHTVHKDEEFVSDILSKLRNTEVGNLCRTDDLIQQVGYRHFCLRRCEVGKKDEIRKAVMCEIRELARLFLAFRSLSTGSVNTEDMFTRKHLATLREAIELMSQSDDGGKEKHGLKLNLNAVIQRTIKSLKGFYTESLQDQKYEEVGKFQLAYNFRSHELYANARYQCVANSMDKARRPEELPVEEELSKLKDFISGEVKKLEQNFSTAQYTLLRSLVVSRLTLYNGRRGEEPSRMLLTEWQDARDGTWLPPDKMESVNDPAEKYLLGQHSLAYLHGKGRKFVPVLIPNDMTNAIQILVEYREPHGIRANNVFVFASKKSSCHCSGWHAVKQVADKAKVLINATKNRHRISTIYAGLHMCPADQKVFFDHMGHEAAISVDNYQCPQGLKEVRVMGSLLSQIDQSSDVIRSPPEQTVICAMEKSSSSSPPEQTDMTELEKSPLVLKTGSDVLSSPPEQTTLEKSLHERDIPKTVNWSEEDSRSVHTYFARFFQGCIQNDASRNTGNLPSKSEIMKYLETSRPKCLQNWDIQTAYKKTRTKLFNERKTYRFTLRRNLDKLS